MIFFIHKKYYTYNIMNKEYYKGYCICCFEYPIISDYLITESIPRLPFIICKNCKNTNKNFNDNIKYKNCINCKIAVIPFVKFHDGYNMCYGTLPNDFQPGHIINIWLCDECQKDKSLLISTSKAKKDFFLINDDLKDLIYNTIKRIYPIKNNYDDGYYKVYFINDLIKKRDNKYDKNILAKLIEKRDLYFEKKQERIKNKNEIIKSRIKEILTQSNIMGTNLNKITTHSIMALKYVIQGGKSKINLNNAIIDLVEKYFLIEQSDYLDRFLYLFLFKSLDFTVNDHSKLNMQFCQGIIKKYNYTILDPLFIKNKDDLKYFDLIFNKFKFIIDILLKESEKYNKTEAIKYIKQNIPKNIMMDDAITYIKEKIPQNIKMMILYLSELIMEYNHYKKIYGNLWNLYLKEAKIESIKKIIKENKKIILPESLANIEIK